MSKNILIEYKESIGIIILNRPEKLNAFHLPMVDEWRYAIKNLINDERVKVIVMTGSGTAFCSGGDIADLMKARKEMGPESRKSELTEHVHKLVKELQTTDKPIIAAMNGVATGAGLDLALYADLRYASESARFAETYVRVGLIPGAGGAWLLPRIVGEAKALEMLWTSNFIDAQEAKKLGLINDVFEDSSLMSQVLKIAEKISNGPQGAIRAIKRAIVHGRSSDLYTSLDHISSTYGLIATGPDHHEAVQAFLEKRKPKFT